MLHISTTGFVILVPRVSRRSAKLWITTKFSREFLFRFAATFFFGNSLVVAFKAIQTGRDDFGNKKKVTDRLKFWCKKKSSFTIKFLRSIVSQWRIKTGAVLVICSWCSRKSTLMVLVDCCLIQVIDTSFQVTRFLKTISKPLPKSP